jgi:hypothetical protein
MPRALGCQPVPGNPDHRFRGARVDFKRALYITAAVAGQTRLRFRDKMV